MKRKYVPLSVAERYLAEGDVLLYRGQGFISHIIAKAGRGDYSHCALLSKKCDEWECLEFREFIGSRATPLSNEVKLNPNRIDVFRPISPVPVYDFSIQGGVKIVEAKYNGKAATNCFRSFIGLKYGWKRIALFIYRRFLLIRLFWDMPTDDLTNGTIDPVCSTAVCHAIATTYCDPVPNLADSMVEPCDLGRSALLAYLFTIEE